MQFMKAQLFVPGIVTLSRLGVGGGSIAGACAATGIGSRLTGN